MVELMQAKHLLPSIRRDTTAKPLLFHTNDVIPLDHHALAGTVCQEVRTAGDGACALHAAWGHINPTRKQLECANPRRRLRDILNHPYDTIVSQTRPHMRELLEKVTTSVWQDFVVQSLSTGAVASEEQTFMNRLSNAQNHSFFEECREHVRRYRTSEQNRDEAFRKMQNESSTIFRFDLEESLWRPLASKYELLPSCTEAYHLIDKEHINARLLLASTRGEENVNFLEEPWNLQNGNYIVKGTNELFIPDGLGGPVSKYAALFDERSVFNNLRCSFLIQVHLTADSLEDFVASSMTLSFEQKAALNRFSMDCLGPYEHTLLDNTPPRNFIGRAWSILVECMCSEEEQ